MTTYLTFPLFTIINPPVRCTNHATKIAQNIVQGTTLKSSKIHTLNRNVTPKNSLNNNSNIALIFNKLLLKLEYCYPQHAFISTADISDHRIPKRMACVWYFKKKIKGSGPHLKSIALKCQQVEPNHRFFFFFFFNHHDWRTSSIKNHWSLEHNANFPLSH